MVNLQIFFLNTQKNVITVTLPKKNNDICAQNRKGEKLHEIHFE